MSELEKDEPFQDFTCVWTPSTFSSLRVERVLKKGSRGVLDLQILKPCCGWLDVWHSSPDPKRVAGKSDEVTTEILRQLIHPSRAIISLFSFPPKLPIGYTLLPPPMSDERPCSRAIAMQDCSSGRSAPQTKSKRLLYLSWRPQASV